MRKSRFSEEQIIAILREQEAGMAVAEACAASTAISSPTFYKWKAKLRRPGRLRGAPVEGAGGGERPAEAGCWRRAMLDNVAHEAICLGKNTGDARVAHREVVVHLVGRPARDERAAGVPGPRGRTAPAVRYQARRARRTTARCASG